MTQNYNRLRRALAGAGLSPAAGAAEAAQGRSPDASIEPARLVEHDALCVQPVGQADAWPGPVAFLDGIQRHEVVAYADTTPVVLAEIAAAVRRREGRRLHTGAEAHHTLLLARPAVLERITGLAPGCRPVPLPDDSDVHPVRDLLAARALIDRERGRLEISVGQEYRRGASGWLVVDGSIAESAQWAADGRMLGVIKSHASLPFSGADQVRYLQLPLGHRTSVFAPASRAFAPVYAWALRLWPWAGRDLLHGLVRVEAAPTGETLAQADVISRWLLAERCPISAPDARWDRLLYGIHDVEVYLRARLGRR